MSSSRTLLILTLFSVLLAFFATTFGAYVRLTHASLGCPDWPSCYGQLIVPNDTNNAQAAYPDKPFNRGKAWREMTHRYLLTLLSLCVLGIAFLAWQQRTSLLRWWLGLVAVGLTLLQILLDMWAVTSLLKPAVVTAHLLVGMATLTFLWWFALQQGGWLCSGNPVMLKRFRLAAWIALFVVSIQIFLGSWVSTQYTALICSDFPTCLGVLVPEYMDFSEGFTLWQSAAVNYQGGVLSYEAQLAVHFTHRVGALFTLLIVAAVVLWMLLHYASTTAVKNLSLTVLILLVIQFCLGVAAVWFSLPLSIAIAHNALATLLLLALVGLNHALYPPK